MYQKSLVILKPDAIQRRYIGKILGRLEQAGFKIHATKFLKANKKKFREHYSELCDKDFYPSIEVYVNSGPALFLVLGGINCIAKIRQLVGATDPASALPGTIRGDLCHMPYSDDNNTSLKNLIHASSCLEDAKKEISLWFKDEEIIDYPMIDDDLISF